MIYYSHVNEDNYAEKQIMDSHHYPNLIAVCGSGERVISLLLHEDLKEAYVCDVSIEALFLLELKLVALSKLSVHQYLEFIGYTNNNSGKENTYEEIKEYLSANCRVYWNENLDNINHGLLNIGHLELFLSRARKTLKYALGSQFYDALKSKDRALSWCSRLRWTIIKKCFSQRWVYALLGLRDKAFLDANARLSIIPDAIQKSIDTQNLAQSCLAHLIFFGHFEYMDQNHLPPSLKISFLNKLKLKLTNQEIDIQYHHKDCMDLLKDKAPFINKNTFLSVSDLLSFEDFEYIESMIDYLCKNTNHFGFTVVLRSFIKNRINDSERKVLTNKKLLLSEISTLDKTNMYQLIQMDNLNH